MFATVVRQRGPAGAGHRHMMALASALAPPESGGTLPPIPRKSLDLEAELQRMQVAAVVRVGFEAQWHRPTGGGLAGPFGQQLSDEIRKAFAGGPHQDYVLDEQTGTRIGLGTPLRWQQLEALTDPSFHPKRQAARELSVLYRNGLTISGEIASPAWDWLKKRADIDRTMIRKQALEIGLGSVAIMPTFRQWGGGQYYPPALSIAYPDECIAIEDPANPGRASVFIRLSSAPVSMRALQKRRAALVWDVSDPSNPSYGAWSSVEAWQRGHAPIFAMTGPAYPWWWQGEPLMPIACSQWNPASTELLPSSLSEHQEMLDLIRERTWCKHVGHSGSFQKALLLSDSELDGLRQSMIDPTVLLNVFGMGTKSLAVVPDSTEATQRLWEMHRDRVAEWAQRYDTGFEVRDSESAKSGAAILLELTGKEVLAQQLETRARPVDTHAIQSVIATHNYLARSGQLSLVSDGIKVRWTPGQPYTLTRDILIPEGEIELAYPRVWSSLERAKIREELVKAADRGDANKREIWLLDHGLDNDRGLNGQPDGPNWRAADEAIRSNLADATAYAALGYGLNAAQLAQLANRTQEAEETLHVPPADVAMTASKGLNLREAFPGRALVGLGNQNTVRLRRARGLRDQAPMRVGDVRAMATDLEAIRRDREIQGDVDNNADPSGLYITWLTQGGAEGVAWCESILALTAPAAPAAPVQQEAIQ